jgi:hypothetical protein
MTLSVPEYSVNTDGAGARYLKADAVPHHSADAARF